MALLYTDRAAFLCYVFDSDHGTVATVGTRTGFGSFTFTYDDRNANTSLNYTVPLITLYLILEGKQIEIHFRRKEKAPAAPAERLAS